MLNIFWLIVSYFIGSIPSGYLVSKYYGKNILEVGWRKTSGSNVFKNVGKGAGILTGLLDLLKGFLVVYGAKSLGLSNIYQILSGVLAVTGNNWSVFLKFSGGRGLATFLGAFLALTPKFLVLSIAPFLLIALIWQASIATLLFLGAAIILSIYLNYFQTAGLFTLISLVPIFIKRLSPLKELSFNKKEIIWNRFIFDDDIPHTEFKIKRLVDKLTKR